ncbi:MAG: undecaprenyl-diphosphate phosphatase [Ruthenibacterium sp.]
MIDIFKAALLGIIEGITEWLPISSTGHLILADELIKLGVTPAFKEMFDVVIQLGAILAVVVLFWSKLWPFCNNRAEKGFIDRYCKKDVWSMWFKVVVATLPAMIIGLPLDDWMTEHLHNPPVVAAMLILYGIFFILLETFYTKGRRFAVRRISQMTYPIALGIGLFQVLSLVPGTSRSGATILGAMLLGCSRTISAEFTFFLAIPAMAGASLIKLLKFNFAFTGMEIGILLTGMLVAFIVSVFSIHFLMNYVKKHDFKIFGWYRIVLGIVVLGYFYLLR